MTYEELIRWNQGLCPKCGSPLHFKKSISDNGEDQFLILCEICLDSHKKVLTATNITDIERNRIIEDNFGNNRSLLLSKEFWENSLLKGMCFSNTATFIRWLFLQIDPHADRPNYKTPPDVMKDLINFHLRNYFDIFNEQLAIFYDLFGNSLFENEYLNFYTTLRKIKKELPELKPPALFKQDDSIIKSTIEKLYNKADSFETWRNFFRSLDRKQILFGIRKLMELYQVSKSISQKYFIQVLYSLVYQNQCDDLIQLTDWILSVTENTDLPFITTNYSARSTTEYLHFRQYDDEIKKILFIEENKLSSKKKKLEQEITKLNDQLSKLEVEISNLKSKIVEIDKPLNRYQRANGRIKKLKTFTELNTKERLRKIINSDEPVYYFPEDFFTGTPEIVNQLEPGEIETLKMKLKKASKGILGELKNKVTENVSSS